MKKELELMAVETERDEIPEGRISWWEAAKIIRERFSELRYLHRAEMAKPYPTPNKIKNLEMWLDLHERILGIRIQ